MAPSSSTPAVIERLLNRYDILRPIGQPFGYQQLLANDTHRQRFVVIKSLAIGENTPKGDISCFEREIHLIESLDHPTIPRYIESFTVEPNSGENSHSRELVLVQGHNGGRTLAQLVTAGKIYCEADIKSIAKQLLQGLVYFHSKGLVHRDIRPDNIALDGCDAELGQVSWLNLGTVQYIQAQRQDALVGTYGYMPPEQVGGQATFASDLYSLGATLIYLATGTHLGDHLQRRPHDSHPHGQKNSQRMSLGTIQRLSPSMQQWLNWLIEPAVGDRPASAQKALSALNHLPFAMLKQRLWKKTKAPLMPVPIVSRTSAPDKPYFTQIKQVKKRRSLALVVPPVRLRSAHCQRALPPLLMGLVMMSVTMYLFSLLTFSPQMLNSFEGIAALAAGSLGLMGGLYGIRFLRTGLILLSRSFLRQVHIQLEPDVLLIAYKYWLRSPVYVVNTRREAIYDIATLADGDALRILTHHNRTRFPCTCYQLSLEDGALSPRDIRWLASLLSEWRRQPGSCT